MPTYYLLLHLFQRIQIYFLCVYHMYVCVSLQSAVRNTENNRRIASIMGNREIIILLLIEAMFCLDIKRNHENFVQVPDDIDPAVTKLDLSHNKIEEIDVTSLDAFEYLIILDLMWNEIHYIEEGAFDNNHLLTVLKLSYNPIQMIPSSFGAATNSLVEIYLWTALTAEAIPRATFSECIKLQFLNIGHNPYYMLNVSILPLNLTELSMNYMRLSEFPDLRYQTPYLESLHMQNNRITAIPPDRIQGLNYIKKMSLAGNRLQSLPDLTVTGITTMSLAGNPWLCNPSLCYWYMLPILTIRGDAPTCETPAIYKGQLVMDAYHFIFACDSSKTVTMW